MGAEKITVTKCSCDICQNACNENDGLIEIVVNGGSRDVGPATLNGVLSFHQPYGCSKGIVCVECKIKYLQRYINQLALIPPHPAK